LCDFHKISRVCTSFQDALAVKTSLDLLKWLWNYGGFKLRGVRLSPNVKRETMRQTPKSLRGARTSITMPSLVGLGFHPPPGRPKKVEFLPAALPAAQSAGI